MLDAKDGIFDQITEALTLDDMQRKFEFMFKKEEKKVETKKKK